MQRIRPLVLIFRTRHTTTNISTSLTIQTTNQRIRLRINIRFTLPNGILKRPLHGAISQRLLRIVARLQLQRRTLIFTARANLAKRPTVHTRISFTIHRTFGLHQPLGPPVLATNLGVTTNRTAAPITLVRHTIRTRHRFRLQSLRIRNRLLLFSITLATNNRHTRVNFTNLGTTTLRVGLYPLHTIRHHIRVRTLRTVINGYRLQALRTGLTLQHFRHTDSVSSTIRLATRLQPRLNRTQRLSISLPNGFLLRTTLTISTIITRTGLRHIRVPLLTDTIDLNLGRHQLPTRFTFRVRINTRTRLLIFRLTLATRQPNRHTQWLHRPMHEIRHQRVRHDIPNGTINRLRIRIALDLTLPNFGKRLLRVSFYRITNR